MDHFPPTLLLLAALLAPGAGHAEDLLPGLWEISLEARAEGNAGWAPPPFTVSRCVSAADARDPTALVGQLSTPEASGCTYQERSYTAGALHFRMTCGGSFAIRAEGTVRFSASHFDGEVKATADLGGGAPVTLHNRISGQRSGGC